MFRSADEAIKAFDEAIRLDPNSASAWYGKGLSLDALGRTPKQMPPSPRQRS